MSSASTSEVPPPPSVADLPELINVADRFLRARVREGRGAANALLTDDRAWTYYDIDVLSDAYARVLQARGVQPEQRVIIALPDGADFVGALFGAMKLGAVGVMLNPHLKPEAFRDHCEHARATAAVVSADSPFVEAVGGARWPRVLVRPGLAEDDAALAEARRSEPFEIYPTHREDVALWLFSGGTTGRPKAVQQTHRSFAFTTEAYGHNVLGLGPDDITLSVPKLFFGYATGANLFFPFSVGAQAVLFSDRCTPEALFSRIARFKPTVLINVPTMINHMLAWPEAEAQDLSSVRVCTSAGEALPPALAARFLERFGVEVLDGLGTAEMWHIFLSNRPDAIRPGTLGQAVPGFEVQVCDPTGAPVPDGEAGLMRVRGGALGLGYWHEGEKTRQAFQGEWYVSQDMVSRDAEGYFTYCGRADDMLKVSGKWLSPKEVEDCLLTHEAVGEVAVVGVSEAGLTRPHAFVLLADGVIGDESLDAALKGHVKARLDPYKYPRTVHFVQTLPRTHLGKIDRGALKRMAAP